MVWDDLNGRVEKMTAESCIEPRMPPVAVAQEHKLSVTERQYLHN